MKAVVQRVSSAEVRVVSSHPSELENEELVGRVGTGMLVLLAALEGDGEREALRLAERVASFRFFEDAGGRMGRSVVEGGTWGVKRRAVLPACGGVAVAATSLWRRALTWLGGLRAAAPAAAEPLVETFVRRLRELGVPSETGRFGARMRVASVNEGPVTFVLEEVAPTGRGPSQVPT